MSTLIPPWTRANNLSVTAHQRVVDAVNAGLLLTGTRNVGVRVGPNGRTIIDHATVTVTDLFFGLVTDAGPDGEADLTDNQYWIAKQRFNGAAADPVDIEDDESPVGEMITDSGGDPLAESIVAATDIGNPTERAWAVDDVVFVVGVFVEDDESREKRYVGIPLKPTSGGFLVKLTSNAAGGGWYNGKILTGTTTLDGTADFDPDTGTIPGLIEAADCLIINTIEAATHAMSLPCYAIGVQRGVDGGGKPIVFVRTEVTGTLFKVALTQTGGSNGTTGSAATWTYTATSLSGNTLGTGLSPEKPRPFGTMTAATRGTGYLDGTGAFTLSEAYEKEGSTVCPA